VGIHVAETAVQLEKHEIVAARVGWLLQLMHCCLSSDTAALINAAGLVLIQTTFSLSISDANFKSKRFCSRGRNLRLA
jgi:hypothetical protein